MSKRNEVIDLSMDFSVRVVNLYKYLCNEKREYVISKQLLRSGTSIGANAREAVYAQSRSDFIAKLSISLKEASETEYWLELLQKTDYISNRQFISISNDCSRLIRILISIIKFKSQKLWYRSFERDKLHA